MLYTYDSNTREYLTTIDWVQPNEWVALPADATPLQPPVQREKFAVVLNIAGDAWEYIEDHRGEVGFIKGHPHTILELGPLPFGWSYTAPEAPVEDTTAIRKTQLMQALNNIDTRSIRPLRATVAGAATTDDERILAELESQAAALRAELATLG